MTTWSTDRRDLLRKAAIGGAVVWTAPVVLSTAAAAGSAAPGCTFVPTTFAVTCGPPQWSARTTFDVAACAGSTLSIDTINGSPITGYCGPVSGGIDYGGGTPFTVTLEVTLRDVCDGTILAGPVTVVADLALLCQGPGNAPDGAAPQADPNATITVSVGGQSIEVPAG